MNISKYCIYGEKPQKLHSLPICSTFSANLESWIVASAGSSVGLRQIFLRPGHYFMAQEIDHFESKYPVFERAILGFQKLTNHWTVGVCHASIPKSLSSRYQDWVLCLRNNETMQLVAPNTIEKLVSLPCVVLAFARAVESILAATALQQLLKFLMQVMTGFCENSMWKSFETTKTHLKSIDIKNTRVLTTLKRPLTKPILLVTFVTSWKQRGHPMSPKACHVPSEIQ